MGGALFDLREDVHVVEKAEQRAAPEGGTGELRKGAPHVMPHVLAVGLCTRPIHITSVTDYLHLQLHMSLTV